MSKQCEAELQPLWFVGEAVRPESLFSKYAELLLTPWRPLRYPHPPLRRSLIMVGNESGHLCKCHNGIFLRSPLIWQHGTCFFTGVCLCCFLINSLADKLLAGRLLFFFWTPLAKESQKRKWEKKNGREGYLVTSAFSHTLIRSWKTSACVPWSDDFTPVSSLTY